MSPTGMHYPWLNRALLALPQDALRLWGDTGERRRAFAALLSSWEAGSPEQHRPLHRIDEAVARGLALLGLPRGPVSGWHILEGYPHLVGAKMPDCSLVFGAEGMRE
jgi:hypothetical protein